MTFSFSRLPAMRIPHSTLRTYFRPLVPSYAFSFEGHSAFRIPQSGFRIWKSE